MCGGATLAALANNENSKRLIEILCLLRYISGGDGGGGGSVSRTHRARVIHTRLFGK